jgi:hypothetical protein
MQKSRIKEPHLQEEAQHLVQLARLLRLVSFRQLHPGHPSEPPCQPLHPATTQARQPRDFPVQTQKPSKTGLHFKNATRNNAAKLNAVKLPKEA